MEEDDFISSHRKAKADTAERERDQLGYTADPKVRNCQAKRAVVPNEANTVTGQVLATEYS